MMIGESFKEGCHTVAREALRTMCSVYREEIQQTPMKFFPPSFRTHEERRNQEKLVEDQRLSEDPTVPDLVLYLLALDERHDQMAAQLRKASMRAENVETLLQRYRQSLIDAQSQDAATRNAEVTRSMALADTMRSQREIPFATNLQGVTFIEAMVRQALEGSAESSSTQERVLRQPLSDQEKREMGMFLTLSFPAEDHEDHAQ